MRFAALIFVVLLVACSEPAEQLVGVWESEDNGYINRLDLRADGTYSGALRRAEGHVGNYSGTWQVQRKQFFGLFVTESDFELLAPGYNFAKEIADYTGDSFALRATNGHEETWRRVK